MKCRQTVTLSHCLVCTIAVAVRVPCVHLLLIHPRHSKGETKTARDVSPRTRAARRTRRILHSCASVHPRAQIHHLALAPSRVHSDQVRTSWRRSARPIIMDGCARRANTTRRGKTDTSSSRDPTYTGLGAMPNRWVSRRLMLFGVVLPTFAGDKDQGIC